mmetsp:Transcript_27189/g.80217  ORF Transcript_27189/g.80217 Transcript_27189/m.80217 type:complete len:217 (-) Transcript_27189:259-909(-)
MFRHLRDVHWTVSSLPLMKQRLGNCPAQPLFENLHAPTVAAAAVLSSATGGCKSICARSVLPPEAVWKDIPLSARVIICLCSERGRTPLQSEAGVSARGPGRSAVAAMIALLSLCHSFASFSTFLSINTISFRLGSWAVDGGKLVRACDDVQSLFWLDSGVRTRRSPSRSPAAAFLLPRYSLPSAALLLLLGLFFEIYRGNSFEDDAGVGTTCICL